LLGRLIGLWLLGRLTFIFKAVALFKRFLVGFVQDCQQLALKKHVDIVESENTEQHLAPPIQLRHSGNALHQRQTFYANQIALDDHGLDFLQAFLLDPLKRPEPFHLALEFAVSLVDRLKLAHDGVEVRVVTHVSRSRPGRRTNNLTLIDQIHITAKR